MARNDDNDLSEQCIQILREVYSRSMRNNPRKIHPAWLAAGAYNKMDKGERAPLLVRYAARLALRKMAGSLCREEHEKQETAAERGQQELFELQRYYPVKRDGDEIYIPRMDMTLADRQETITRLRSESASKGKHADALQAETDTLMAHGYFEQQAA